ncbi:MAG: low temperature requirement protein A [Candidatus Peribacteria bacterium]|nr:MAG: low temperature requirement protein A [Candidatus Peribacteria bacterium]
METIIYITAVWRLWSSITYFFERYKTQGLTKRLFMFVQMFLIAGMVLTITGGPEVSQIFFLIYGIAK